MKKILFLGLLLTGCANSESGYRPQLSEQPTNIDAYESDRLICIRQGGEKWEVARQNYVSSGNTIGSAFGLIGGLAQAGVDEGHIQANRHADYYKMPSGLADECMTAKGYKIAN